MADEPAPAKDAPKEPEKTPEPEPTPDPKADGELPEAVREILSKERKAARDADRARKAAEQKVKEFEDRDKSETERLTESVSRTERERDEALAKLDRYEVATEKKLPAELVNLLSGTREEMEAKADLLLEHTADKKPPPDFDGGVREPAPENMTPEQAHGALLAQQVFGKPRQPQQP